MQQYNLDHYHKPYIRSTKAENREYAKLMDSMGMEKVYIPLEGGRQGYIWSRKRESYQPSTEPAEAPIGPPAFGEPPTGQRFPDGYFRDEDQRHFPEELPDHERAKRILGGK